MRDPLQTLTKEKFRAAMVEMYRRFGLPLVFFDIHGKELSSVGMDCDGRERASKSEPSPGEGDGSYPVHFMNDVIGNLVVRASAQESRGIAPILAYCLENTLKLEAEITDLSSEVVRVYEEISLLFAISNKLGCEMDVATICHRVLEEADKILSPFNLSIMLLDSSKKGLYTRHSIGRNAESARSFTADISSGLIGHVLRLGEPVTVCDIRADSRITLPYPAKSILCVPLVTDDKPIGLLLACDKRSGEEFWSRDLKMMSMFASEIAASIRKAQLYEKNNKMFINTVEALASAIDTKDPYTYGHSKRVAQISVALCAELGIPQEETRLVELAALLHDIGKIGTPESILHKCEKLKPEEFEKIKAHPIQGSEILSSIEEFNEIIIWIKHHHEWYNGNGYPDRITADSIPIEARIITIADAYDAMTSNRPYRKAMSSHEAVRMMEEFSGSQFDPAILQAFASLLHNGRVVAEPAAAAISRSFREATSPPPRNNSNQHLPAGIPGLDSQRASNPPQETNATEPGDGGLDRPSRVDAPPSTLHAVPRKRRFNPAGFFIGNGRLLYGLITAATLVLISLGIWRYDGKATNEERKGMVNDTVNPTSGQTTVKFDTHKNLQPSVSFAEIRFKIIPWGEIYVDGERRGSSPPLKALRIETGEHEIVIRNSSLKQYRRSVRLNQRDSVTIEHRFATKQSTSTRKGDRKTYHQGNAKYNNKAKNSSSFTATITP
ncbi:MAG: HD domain-containing protein [Deltaproteobacteria bacterium]|nr:HD domain-containing protein [Deltaproteobacteria bacterium]